MAENPVIHGRDHRGIHPATGKPAGADPAKLIVDATSNVGTGQGVGSYAATLSQVLTSDGAGGSTWADPPLASDDPGAVFMDITAVTSYPSVTGHNQGTLFEIEATAQIAFLAGTLFAVTSGSTTSFAALNFIVSLHTAGGHVFEVRDSGNNAIFRVLETGTVHIKTGTSIAADL